MLDFSSIDSTWTLFLDRDGVINKDKEGSYIFNVNEFLLLDGVTDAIKILAEIFGIIIVVTNQKGIGKKLMTENDLEQIHKYMLQEIYLHKGRIDKIYFAPELEDESPNRKPNTGMALQAKKDFPAIDFF